MSEPEASTAAETSGNKITQQIRQAVELASKNWVVVAAAIYGSGYVIVSLYHSSLGLNQVDALSPQIAAAGLIFFVFLAAAVFLLHYSRRVIFGFANQLQGPRRFAFVALFGSCFVLVFDIITIGILFLKVFHFEGVQPYPHAFPIVMFPGVLFFFSAVWSHNSEQTPRWIFHWITQLCCGLFLAAVGYMSFPQEGVFGIRQAAWLASAFQFMWAGAVNVMTDERRLINQNWVVFASELVLPLFIYGGYVYPHVNGAFGEGDPTAATITLVAPSAGSAKQKYSAHIISESTNGFYVRVDSAKTVRFIPRGQVDSIDFDEPMNPVWHNRDK
jgi:hypothetical protein